MRCYSQLVITEDDITKIIAKLGPNKAHGHDKISIYMTKIWCTFICRPLRLVFNHYLNNSIYASEWKKLM